MGINKLFLGDDGMFVVLGDDPRKLLRELAPFSVRGTLVAGISRKGTVWARFALRPDAGREDLHLKVVYCGSLYEMRIPCQRVGAHVIFDGMDVASVTDGALLHAYGITKDGQFVSYPRFAKKLGEVPSCTKCPFWATGDLGEKECARLRWQPAGLHFLNEPQCSTEDRQRQGVKALKVFDHAEDARPVSILGEVVWNHLRQVRNAARALTHEPIVESREETIARMADKVSNSPFCIELDGKLADAGCEWPVFHLAEGSLRALMNATDSLREAAQVVNHLQGRVIEGQLEEAIEAVREEAIEEMDSIERLLEWNLV